MSRATSTKELFMPRTTLAYRVRLSLVNSHGATMVLRSIDPNDEEPLIQAVNDVVPGYTDGLVGGRDFQGPLDREVLVAQFRLRMLEYAARMGTSPDEGASLLVTIQDDEGKLEMAYRMVCESVKVTA